MIPIVLDTNVLISGLLWRGSPYQLMERAEHRVLRLCLNESMVRELADVLYRPKFLSRMKQLDVEPAEVLAAGLEHATIFEDVRLEAAIARDPDDDLILACAVTAKAHCIVSGDKDLLSLLQFHGIPIYPPHIALKQLPSKP